MPYPDAGYQVEDEFQLTPAGCVNVCCVQMFASVCVRGLKFTQAGSTPSSDLCTQLVVPLLCT